MPGVPEGLGVGDVAEPLEPPEPPPPAPGVGVADCDPPPLDGVAVGDEPDGDEPGDDVGDDEVGDEVGDGVDDGVAAATGGATPGGTAPLFSRSCCQDHPTEPPAGTVRLPAPEDEYAHEADEPSAHHRPQYALDGDALTHGSLVGTPLTRHTNPGWRVASVSETPTDAKTAAALLPPPSAAHAVTVLPPSSR